MNYPRFLPMVLTAVLVAQSVIGGGGHFHAHRGDGADGHLAVAGHAHDHYSTGEHQHRHFHTSHEHLPLPNRPAEKDDCSVCRHLALAAVLTLDLEVLVSGDPVELVQSNESSFASTIAIGLRRPRSPPELTS